MKGLVQDVRFALRGFRRTPAFVALAVATLGIGIGANTAIFSVAEAVLFRPLPYRDPSRLVQLWGKRPKLGQERLVWSYPDFRDCRTQSASLAGAAAFADYSVNLTGNGRPERLLGAFVSTDFLRVLGIAPVLGRDFAPGEETPGGDAVVLLTRSFLVRRFGGDPSIVGRVVHLDGKPYTVIGVVPDGIRLPTLSPDTALFVPISHGFGLDNRSGHYLSVVARLKPGLTLAAVRAELAGISRGLVRRYPGSETVFGITAYPLSTEIAVDARPAVLVLLGAVGLVLLISLVNLAHMLLARTSARQAEIAVRMAIGSGRWRLVRQLLTESVVLAFAGGAAGVLIAAAGVSLLKALGPTDIARLDEVRLDTVALAYAAAISFVAGLFFGIAPAWKSASRDPFAALKRAGRASRDEGSAGLREALVVAEFALSVMLLIGAGLMLKSFRQLTRVDIGFSPERLVAAELDLPESKYPHGRQINAFLDRLLERSAALPGVASAAAITDVPLRQARPENLSYLVEGRPRDASNVLIAVYNSITPGYFATVGLPVVSGRVFGPGDGSGAPAVVIVNETFARHAFPGRDPVGRRISLGDAPKDSDWIKIVGVVRDVRSVDLQTPPRSQMYMPFAQQADSGFALVLRVRPGRRDLAPDLRRIVASLDPDQPVYGIRTMDQIVSESVTQPRFRTTLIVIFAGIAVVLAMTGIYGVVSYLVSGRAREIGIRLALGATPSDVVRLVVGDGMRGATLGVAVGLGAAAAAARVLRTLLFGVAPTDIATFAAVAAILLGVGLLACALPARSAARTDPATTLRTE